MVFNKIPGGRVGHFLAGATVASVLGGTAIAISSPSFRYSETHTGYYTINPMAMAPGNTQSSTDFETNWDPVALATGLAEGCFQTGINFPQGATLVSFKTYYRSDASSNPVTYFVRYSLESDGTSAITSTISDNSNTHKAVTKTVPAGLGAIDNARFGYSYGVCIGTGTIFYGASFKYRYKTAGD